MDTPRGRRAALPHIHPLLRAVRLRPRSNPSSASPPEDQDTRDPSFQPAGLGSLRGLLPRSRHLHAPGFRVFPVWVTAAQGTPKSQPSDIPQVMGLGAWGRPRGKRGCQGAGSGDRGSQVGLNRREGKGQLGLNGQVRISASIPFPGLGLRYGGQARSQTEIQPQPPSSAHAGLSPDPNTNPVPP